MLVVVGCLKEERERRGGRGREGERELRVECWASQLDN